MQLRNDRSLAWLVLHISGFVFGLVLLAYAIYLWSGYHFSLGAKRKRLSRRARPDWWSAMAVRFRPYHFGILWLRAIRFPIPTARFRRRYTGRIEPKHLTSR